MQVLRNPSLAINWLKTLDKTIHTPIVIYSDVINNYSGCLIPPSFIDDEYFIEGMSFNRKYGIICVSAECEKDIKSEANVIAHEFRHLWQYYQSWKYDGIGWVNLPDYKRNIIKYFRSSRSEMDALHWAQIKAPSLLCEEWIEWINHA